jgi:hypothetical protein
VGGEISEVKKMEKKTIIAIAMAMFLAMVGGASASENLVVNPSFEDDFNGWEPIYQPQYCPQPCQVVDDAFGHFGSKSAKLYMRWGGGYIGQTIDVNIPANSVIKFSYWVYMPSQGASWNKWLSAGFSAYSADGQQVSNGSYVFGPHAEWTKKEFTLVPSFDVTKLSVGANTANGGGGNGGYDMPLWLDDFEVTIEVPPTTDDANKGHGNDADGMDSDNPGKGCEKKNANGNQKRC